MVIWPKPLGNVSKPSLVAMEGATTDKVTAPVAGTPAAVVSCAVAGMATLAGGCTDDAPVTLVTVFAGVDVVTPPVMTPPVTVADAAAAATGAVLALIAAVWFALANEMVTSCTSFDAVTVTVAAPSAQPAARLVVFTRSVAPAATLGAVANEAKPELVVMVVTAVLVLSTAAAPLMAMATASVISAPVAALRNTTWYLATEVMTDTGGVEGTVMMTGSGAALLPQPCRPTVIATHAAATAAS